MQGRKGGDGVEDADGGFLSEEIMGRVEYAVVVTGKGIDTVVLQGTQFVPAVIPEVMHYKVEAGAKERPEWVVEVGGETVAMANDEPRAFRVPVASQEDDFAIVDFDTVNG